MTGKLTLKNMRFHAYHGVFEEENRIGATYIVSLTLYLDLPKAAETDNLDDTLNYQQAYDVVKREMAQPSRLIEHVAGRILKAVCREFPTVKEAEICLRKMNPPLGADIESADITLSTRDL